MSRIKTRAKAPKRAKAKPPTLAELEAEYIHRRCNLISTLTEGDMWIHGPDDLPVDVDELQDALDEIEQHGWNHVSDAKDLREALDALEKAKWSRHNPQDLKAPGLLAGGFSFVCFPCASQWHFLGSKRDFQTH